MIAIALAGLLLNSIAIAGEVDPVQIVGCDDATPCTGIRPGALIHTPGSSDCTANFVLVARNGTYIMTAAHCTAEVGQEVWFVHANRTSSAQDVRSRPADGAVAFIHPLRDPERPRETQAFDIALIQIHSHALQNVDASVCHWGGPKGVSAAPSPHEPAYFYGHGIGFHDTQEARVGAGVQYESEAMFVVTTAATLGDSGGPWLDHQLGAIGFEVRGSAGEPGTDKGIRLDYALKELSAYGYDVRLLLEGERPPHAEVEGGTDESPQIGPGEAPVPGATTALVLASITLASGMLRSRRK